MKIKKYILLVFCILLCDLVYSQKEPTYIIEFMIDTVKARFETDIDTTKCLFFLDNKKVSILDIFKGLITESVEWHLGFSKTHDVLLNFGEKYRNFEVKLYVTRKKDEEVD